MTRAEINNLIIAIFVSVVILTVFGLFVMLVKEHMDIFEPIAYATIIVIGVMILCAVINDYFFK